SFQGARSAHTPRRSVIDEQRRKGEKAAQPPEGESALGCLAALFAPHRSLWTCSSLAPCHPPKPLSRDVARYFNRLLGGEHFGRRNLHFNGSPKKVEQDPNPFFRREQASNHDLQSLEWPFGNLNRLTNFDGGIDSHDFISTHARLKPDHNVFRKGRQAIPKVDDPLDSVRTFSSAMLFRIDEFREQITWKHRLHEPHRPPVGHLAEAQSRRETLDAELTPEGDGSQMLPLRLRL